VNADEAYRIGLLDRIVPADKLIEESISMANQIASLPPIAMQVARRVLQQSMESSFEAQLRNESNGLIMARRAPHDMQEQRDSFLQKRPPKFTGK
jgi:enoyl-CoA hydratase/carnithine racemase